MKIGQVLDAVYDADVGWRPASGTIKPVHVANGLVRALQKGRYDVRHLHEFIVWYQKGKKPDDARTFEALLKAHPEHYASFDGRAQDFDRARRYANGLLGADDALYPSADHSSFSLTSGRMVTRDNNDRQLGIFGAVLLGERDDPESLAWAVLEAVSAERPRDPLAALVWPLIQGDKKEEAPSAETRTLQALRKAHNRQFVSMMEEASRCLATHEQSEGNHMLTLQRAVQFVCIGTFVHAQSLAAGGALDERPPALMSLAGGRQSDVAYVSERSVDRIFSKFESWLAQRLGRLIAKGQPLLKDEEPLPADTGDIRRVRRMLSQISADGKGDTLPSEDAVLQRLHYFKTAKQQIGTNAKPAYVLASALVSSYCREFHSGGPRRFLQGLGRRAGLLYPHFAGAAREKRVRPSVPVLDMLVRACVPCGERIPLRDFLDRLWERFGLIVGGRRDSDADDADLLARHELLIDTPQLVANVERLVDELVVMGLARRFADNVTFVGDGHE